MGTLGVPDVLVGDVGRCSAGGPVVAGARSNIVAGGIVGAGVVGPLTRLGVRSRIELGSTGCTLGARGEVLGLSAYIVGEFSALAVGLSGKRFATNGAGGLVLDGGIAAEIDLIWRKNELWIPLPDPCIETYLGAFARSLVGRHGSNVC
jgi:hypothetical protein